MSWQVQGFQDGSPTNGRGLRRPWLQTVARLQSAAPKISRIQKCWSSAAQQLSTVVLLCLQRWVVENRWTTALLKCNDFYAFLLRGETPDWSRKKNCSPPVVDVLAQEGGHAMFRSLTLQGPSCDALRCGAGVRGTRWAELCDMELEMQGGTRNNYFE